MNKLLTIIIPIYNSEKFLDRCLGSILVQSYSNYEVLLIDDGSTDDTKKICLNYCNKDERFKYVYKSNSGVSDSRNLGLQKMSGELVCFIDSDDYILENHFSGLESHFDDTIDFLSCGYIETTVDSKEIIRTMDNNIFNRNSLVNLVISEISVYGFCWNKIYRASIIKKYDLKFKSNIHVAEDLVFNLDYLYHINIGKIIDQCSYIYSYNGDSVMRAEISYENLTKKISTIEAKVYILENYSEIDESIKLFLRRRIVLDSSYYYRLSKINQYDFLRILKGYIKSYISDSSLTKKEYLKVLFNMYFSKLIHGLSKMRRSN